MQIFILIMLMGLFAYDSTNYATPYPLEGSFLALITLSPFLFIIAIVSIASLLVTHSLRNHPTHATRNLRIIDHILNAAQLLTLIAYFLSIYTFGALDALRILTHPYILPANLIILIPPLATIIFTWYAYYPIDRILREASFLRQLQQGQDIPPILTRFNYVLSHIRHQLLIILAPLLILMTWIRTVDHFITPIPALPPFAISIITFAGSLAIFALAPLLIRYLWNTQPLPQGPTRENLLALCKTYNIRISQLLLWDTHSSMVNGAVMGITSRLRYILLTDALLQSMDDDQVQAVMAHELAHIKFHHMPWMAICAITPLWALGAIFDKAILYLYNQTTLSQNIIDKLDILGLIILIASCLTIFGYISRRFERQADTFAAQHLSTIYPDPDLPPNHFSPKAANLAANALLRVAQLNHIPTPNKPTFIQKLKAWRHGPITWRADYLQTLASTPTNSPPIHKQLRNIRYLALTILIAILAHSFYTEVLPTL